jgi:hypothetical protein
LLKEEVVGEELGEELISVEVVGDELSEDLIGEKVVGEELGQGGAWPGRSLARRTSGRSSSEELGGDELM